MRYRILFLCLLASAALHPVSAFAGNAADEPGYMDLSWITIPDGAAEVQDIDLGDVLLSIANDAKEQGDSSLAQALSMIHSVRVKAFSLTEKDLPRTEKAVKKIMSKLEKGGWSRLIYAKDDQETVTVNTKSVDGKMVGLMVVVFDPTDEAVFVNVAGDLNLGTLFQLAQKFGVDDLDELLQESTSVEVETTDTVDAPAGEAADHQ